MTREHAIQILRDHAAELQATGVRSLSLFGSTARNEKDPEDVDVAVLLDGSFSSGGYDYFWQREQLRERLSGWLGCRVGVVEEPVRKARLRQGIERDRALAF